MTYLVFDTEAEAEAAEAAIWQAMQPMVETRNGVPVPDESRVTQRWAIPRQIAGGRWVIAAPLGWDGEPPAVAAEAAWWPVEDGGGRR